MQKEISIVEAYSLKDFILGVKSKCVSLNNKET